MDHPHIAPAVLMVRPMTFGFDDQTAVTNTFQQRVDESSRHSTAAALREFDAYVAALQAQDIDVVIFEDRDATPKPNAVFPNNWLTTWPNGTVYTYPMATPSRRAERTPAVLDLLRERYTVGATPDLSGSEDDEQYLEGTGAIIFDHLAKQAYACISPRCDEALFKNHVQHLGHEPISFRAVTPDGIAVYHTNVMLSIQTKTAVLYSTGITDATERHQVTKTLEQSGHRVIDITAEQLAQFCGNILQVQNRSSEPFVIMSQTAYDAFTPPQRQTLSQSGTLLPVAIPTIETIGGGSARCMLAEIFLPQRV